VPGKSEKLSAHRRFLFDRLTTIWFGPQADGGTIPLISHHRVSTHSIVVAPDSPPSQMRSSFLRSAAWMVSVGFVVRLIGIAVIGLPRFNVIYWSSFEMANIGYSLVRGLGFSSPFLWLSGPTAWTPPLYPWLVSVAFRVFGPFTDGAATALLSFNSVFSALTSWTVYRIARRLFDERVALWSGWIWAFFPFAIYWSVTWIWETALSAFLLSLLFMLTLEMDGDNRLRTWLRYGLLWGLVALVNTSMLIWLPFAGCWLAFRLYRGGKRFLAPAILSAVVFWAVITPWLVRNYVVFHKFIPIRSDLGSELRAGNNPEAQGWFERDYRAGNNHALFAEYKQMGEVAHDVKQGRLAKEWIRENPGRFAILSCRRFFYFWFGEHGSEVQILRPLMILLTLLSFGGLLVAVRHRIPGTFLFASLLIFYPMVYYFTFPTDRYHHAIEPELVILAVLCLVSKDKPEKSLRKA
jgi:4-amino-4-deoxy-L-arabinose transferase-like glycosyltransferase